MIETTDTFATPLPEVSVLIVGFNSRSYIERCISGALMAGAGPAFEFLFIDCSNDGSEALVREKFPTIRVLPYQGNLGFGRANNLLATHARACRILLLNPDTFARRDELTALLNLAVHAPLASGWGGLTVLPSGTIDGGCLQPMLGLLPLCLALVGLSWIRPGAANPRLPQPQEVPVLSGAFMMVRTTMWQQIGGFDERFFLYAEEVDLCKRIADSNGSLVLDPRIQLLHDSGSGNRISASRMLNQARGNATFYDKHYGPTRSALCKAFLWLHGVSRELYGRVRGKTDYVDAYGAIVRQRASWWDGWPKRTDAC